MIRRIFWISEAPPSLPGPEQWLLCGPGDEASPRTATERQRGCRERKGSGGAEKESGWERPGVAMETGSYQLPGSMSPPHRYSSALYLCHAPFYLSLPRPSPPRRLHLHPLTVTFSPLLLFSRQLRLKPQLIAKSRRQEILVSHHICSDLMKHHKGFICQFFNTNSNLKYNLEFRTINDPTVTVWIEANVS